MSHSCDCCRGGFEWLLGEGVLLGVVAGLHTVSSFGSIGVIELWLVIRVCCVDCIIIGGGSIDSCCIGSCNLGNCSYFDEAVDWD